MGALLLVKVILKLHLVLIATELASEPCFIGTNVPFLFFFQTLSLS